MRLAQLTENQLQEMMTWFTTEQELIDWAGPNVRYPFDQSSFSEDLKLNKLNSYAFISPNFELLGFGQFYECMGRCHLGRLAINPKCRGQGYAFELIKQLCAIGLSELQLKECSLFVLLHNKYAIKAYEKFGFSVASYPENMPLDNCIYMVKKY